MDRYTTTTDYKNNVIVPALGAYVNAFVERNGVVFWEVARRHEKENTNV